jgi:hypothetical protein
VTSPAEALAMLEPWIAQSRRTAMRPVVRAGQGAPTASRFNGAPFLLAREAWPTCGACGGPMPLFLQLNLETLPKPYAGELGPGLLQLFYCACKRDEDARTPFVHRSKLVRVITADPGKGAAPAPLHDGLSALAHEIVDWRPHEEGPSVEDAALVGLEREVTQVAPPHYFGYRYKAVELGLDTGWIDPKVSDYQLQERAFNPSLGDKLGGWPHWIQGPDYPACPTCRKPMDYLFQLDSEHHVPFAFGELGCGHIMQCRKHKSVVTFGWSAL